MADLPGAVLINKGFTESLPAGDADWPVFNDRH